MKAVVLTYHSHNIGGSDYATNDHVALAHDLEILNATGARIVPLGAIVDAVKSRSIESASPELAVAITFDDGPSFDFHDFVHPTFGAQRSFLNILRDFRARHGELTQPNLHATSFVIASPHARKAMETAAECGYTFLQDWLADTWWNDAIETGLMGIGNHSWDHVHSAVDKIAITSPQRNNFELVDNYIDADREIRQAADYINSRVGGRCEFFGFPFGQVNAYLVRDYLPNRTAEHRMTAAVGTGGAAVDPSSSVWNIPRAVCGHHWRSPDELRRMLGR